MSDFSGYNQQFTDRPEVWRVDGYVSIGATGAPTTVLTPSSIVQSVVRTGVGAYTLTLSDAPKLLIYVDVKSMILGTSPAYVGVQLLGTTIGQAGVPNPILTFVFNVAGTPTELPVGSVFFYELALQQVV